MNNMTPPSSNAPISEKMGRVHEIISQLESGDVSLERAKQLRDEGRELLTAVEEDLDLGEGSIIENR